MLLNVYISLTVRKDMQAHIHIHKNALASPYIIIHIPTTGSADPPGPFPRTTRTHPKIAFSI